MPYHHLCLRGLGGRWHGWAPRREVVLAVDESRPRVWKRLRHVGLSIPDHKRRRGDQDDGGYNPALVRKGFG